MSCITSKAGFVFGDYKYFESDSAHSLCSTKQIMLAGS